MMNCKKNKNFLKSRKSKYLDYHRLQIEIVVRTITMQDNTQWNHAYYPIILEREEVNLKLKAALEAQEIYPLQYFYSKLNTLDYVETEWLKVSKTISGRVLCLPLYFNLMIAEQERISTIIKMNFKEVLYG